jgi:hypothetical protein
MWHQGSSVCAPQISMAQFSVVIQPCRMEGVVVERLTGCLSCGCGGQIVVGRMHVGMVILMTKKNAKQQLESGRSS